jgi:hypothetical protein
MLNWRYNLLMLTYHQLITFPEMPGEGLTKVIGFKIWL